MAPFLLLPLLIVGCFCPGFFFVRRLRRLTIDERVCLSIALSLLLVYLLGGLIYVSGIDWRWSWLATAVFAGMTLLSAGDLRQLARSRHARQLAAAFAMLIGLGLLLLALVQHYSGGAWAGDWKEHYDRTLFFLQRQHHDTVFIGIYKLPARPPMMHVIAAYFMAHFGPAGSGFDSFQVISLLLNTLVFLPCVLLAGMLVKGGNRKVWMIAAFLAASPVFIQNVTWTWNKLMAGFFVILSVALYVRGWRRQSSGRIIASAASTAGGILVHYSAAPFAVVLSLHYLCVFAWRRRRLFEMVTSSAVVVAILATWFGWAVWAYGAGTTFKSNTTVSGSHDLTVAEWLSRTASNSYSSFVPYPLRKSLHEFNNHLDQPNRFGSLRDFYFLFCQQNLPGSFGLLGWVGVAWLTIRALASKKVDISLRIFWGGFVIVTIAFGIAAVGEENFFGVAHACLQSLTLIGITLLATGITTLPGWGRIALIFSMVVDVVLGIILHFRIQMLAIHSVLVGSSDVVPISRGLINVQGVSTSSQRFRQGTAHLSDHFQSIDNLVLAIVIIALGVLLYAIANTIVGGRGTGRWRFVPVAVVLLYLSGAVLCVQDRRAGYVVVDTLPVPVAPEAEKKLQILQPLELQARLHPESARARYQLGLTKYYLGDFTSGWAETYIALLLDPDDRDIHYLASMFWLAYGYGLNSGEDRLYLVFYGQYRDSDENFVEYGAALVDANLRGRALTVLTEAVKRFPDSPRTHHALGAVLFHAGHPVEGQVELEQALRLDPGSADIAEHLRAVMQSRGVDQSVIDQRMIELRGSASRPNDSSH